MSDIFVSGNESGEPDIGEALHEALIGFTGCVGEALEDICSYSLTIGETYVPFDPDPDDDCPEDDAACSQAWVRVMSVDPAPGGIEGWGGDCGLLLNMNLEVGVLRCLDVPEEGEAPSASDVLVAAMQSMTDMLAIQKAALACEVWESITLGTWTPSGPLGGQYGGIWTFSVEVDGASYCGTDHEGSGYTGCSPCPPGPAGPAGPQGPAGVSGNETAELVSLGVTFTDVETAQAPLAYQEGAVERDWLTINEDGTVAFGQQAGVVLVSMRIRGQLDFTEVPPEGDTVYVEADIYSQGSSVSTCVSSVAADGVAQNYEIPEGAAEAETLMESLISVSVYGSSDSVTGAAGEVDVAVNITRLGAPSPQFPVG